MPTTTLEYEQAGLLFYQQQLPAIERLCYKLLRRIPRQLHKQLIEEMLSEAMRVIPMAIASYDDSKGCCLRSHVFTAIRWRAWEKMRSELVVADFVGLPSEIITSKHSLTIFDTEEVEYIIGSLSECHAKVLHLVYVEEIGPRQLAELLGCSRSTIQRLLREALAAARNVADNIK